MSADGEQAPPLASILLPVVGLHWALTGEPGVALDSLVARMVGAGVQVEPIVAGNRYRLRGDREMLEVVANELRAAPGFELVHETAPATATLTPSVGATHAFKYSLYAHGATAVSHIARAIDRRLMVTPAGINRWRVAARADALVAWAASVMGKSTAEVLEALEWDAAGVEQDNVALPVSLPPISVNLPDRRTTSTISRDADGDIKTVVQIESSITP